MGIYKDENNSAFGIFERLVDIYKYYEDKRKDKEKTKITSTLMITTQSM